MRPARRQVEKEEVELKCPGEFLRAGNRYLAVSKSTR